MNDDKIIIIIERAGATLRIELPEDTLLYNEDAGDYMSYETAFKAILRWLNFNDISINEFIAWMPKDQDDPTFYDKETGYCTYCQHDLIEVRPGKFQCGNMNCSQYKVDNGRKD